MKKTMTATLETEQKNIDALINVVRSKDASARAKAREELIELGHAAVIPLIRLLNDPDEHIRWEAAKALEGIADPASANALVDALDDESAGVRWTAGEALVAIGWEGVKQILVALLRRADSTALCTAAHHALSHFAKRRSGEFLRPVLERLEGPEPAVSVPLAALEALSHLRAWDP